MAQNITKNKKGFSLAETLISLLIVSLIIAATMPIITTKKKTGGDGFWQMNNNSNIYYATGNSQVGVGAAAFTGAGNAKFFINTVAADTRGQIIQRVAGQTANLLEFRQEDGTILSYFDKDGIYNGEASIPTGAVMHFNLSACPAGWQKANGTAALTPELLALTGPNVPDLRGEFIRGWSNGRADLDSGRTFGSSQTNITKFPFETPLNGGTIKYFLVSASKTDHLTEEVVGLGASHYFSDLGASSVARARLDLSSETRPKNVALLACIKN